MKLINVGIIGLGVIGKRMAQNMEVRSKFNILGGYDNSDKKKSEFSNDFPEIKTYSSAEKLIRETELSTIPILVLTGAELNEEERKFLLGETQRILEKSDDTLATIVNEVGNVIKASADNGDKK